MFRVAKLLAFAFAAGLVGLCAYLAVRQAAGNFGVVVAGEVYRSNQPSADELATYAAERGIRSVLNLRGAADGQEWYEAERLAARRLDIRLIDFPMSADERLPRDRFRDLVTLMRDAPKPLLIHCRSGSDRTGLAAVIYLLAIAHADEAVAERQLSIRYGHFSVPWLSDAWPMDVSWEEIETWMGITGS